MKAHPFPRRFPFPPLALAAVACLLPLVWGCGSQESGGGFAQAPYKDGEILVKYKASAAPAARESARARLSASRVRDFAKVGVEQVKLRPGVSVEEAVAEFQADAAVEYAEPNYVVTALEIPNDPLLPNLWGLLKINAPAAWDATTGSDDVVVAVIDSGIDYAHPDLAANIWGNAAELSGAPGVDDDGNGYVDDFAGLNAVTNTGYATDDHSHGTHVSGTIGAVGMNGGGVAGVNWHVRLLPCKFLWSNGSGYISDAIECMQYLRTMKDRGVNIVASNNSWGGGAFSRALYDAIDAQRDILFIVAAGNSSGNNDAAPVYPANYALPNVVSVAATTQSDALASFSCFGRDTVHVAAPGYQILSTVPGGGYGVMSGTSMAAPHVSGLAALLKATDPDLDAMAIRKLLLTGGTPVAGLSGATLTGRRIDAAGSLSCSDSPFFRVTQVPATFQVGVPSTLAALSINCAASAGPVTVTLAGGEVLTLADDGVAPDQAADDGVFSIAWTPTRSAETFRFASPAGSASAGAIPPFAFPAVTLAAPAVGRTYGQRLTATGGAAPYAWALASGRLPPGLVLGTPSGILSGTPTTPGTYAFAVAATDALGHRAVRSFSLTVVNPPLSITSGALPAGKRGTPYRHTLAALGGTKPYVWAPLTALPPGLTFNRTTGLIGGTPTRAGNYTVTMRVTDATRKYVNKNLTVSITN